VSPRTLLLVLIGVVLIPWNAARACTISSPTTIDLGSKSSFDAAVADITAGSGSSGLTCGGILGLLTSQFIYLSLDSKSAGLVNSGTGDSIPFEVTTVPGGAPVPVGTTSGNLAGASLLSLGGSGGEVQLFVDLGAAGNIASGTYTGTITLRWHFATCSAISAIGICIGGWTVSPGISQSCLLGLCTLNQSSVPSSPGSPVQINVTLTVTRDCRFDADHIDFGAAPFADSFEPVTGSLRVTCTKGTTYSVGLSNGNYFNGVRRRMASGANRLEYEVFRSGGQPWDAVSNRAQQLVPAAGNTPETFTYEARIYPYQPTPPPGLYQDVLVIDAVF
jgi:spore coat protein U-like protein